MVVIAGAGFTFTTAEAETLPFSTDVAFTVTVRGEATTGGALYVAAVLDVFANVPQPLPLQPLPDTLQDTPLLLESSLTLAVNFIVWPWSILSWEPGDIATESGGETVPTPPGALDPPPQLVSKNTTTAMMPVDFLTMTCPLPFSKPFVSTLKFVKEEYSYEGYTVNQKLTTRCILNRRVHKTIEKAAALEQSKEP